MQDRFIKWVKGNGHALAWCVVILVSFLYYVLKGFASTVSDVLRNFKANLDKMFVMTSLKEPGFHGTDFVYEDAENPYVTMPKMISKNLTLLKIKDELDIYPLVAGGPVLNRRMQMGIIQGAMGSDCLTYDEDKRPTWNKRIVEARLAMLPRSKQVADERLTKAMKSVRESETIASKFLPRNFEDAHRDYAPANLPYFSDTPNCDIANYTIKPAFSQMPLENQLLFMKKMKQAQGRKIFPKFVTTKSDAYDYVMFTEAMNLFPYGKVDVHLPLLSYAHRLLQREGVETKQSAIPMSHEGLALIKENMKGMASFPQNPKESIIRDQVVVGLQECLHAAQYLIAQLYTTARSRFSQDEWSRKVRLKNGIERADLYGDHYGKPENQVRFVLTKEAVRLEALKRASKLISVESDVWIQQFQMLIEQTKTLKLDEILLNNHNKLYYTWKTKDDNEEPPPNKRIVASKLSDLPAPLRKFIENKIPPINTGLTTRPATGGLKFPKKRPERTVEPPQVKGPIQYCNVVPEHITPATLGRYLIENNHVMHVGDYARIEADASVLASSNLAHEIGDDKQVMCTLGLKCPGTRTCKFGHNFTFKKFPRGKLRATSTIPKKIVIFTEPTT